MKRFLGVKGQQNRPKFPTSTHYPSPVFDSDERLLANHIKDVNLLGHGKARCGARRCLRGFVVGALALPAAKKREQNA